MSHILFVNDGILEILFISFQIFLTHLFRIKHMNLCLSVVNLLRDRRS